MNAGQRSNPLAMVAKKRYSVHETFWIAHDAARTLRHLPRIRSRGRRFTESLMLAVTEVNGCALCAYGHTRFALDAGMSGDEVRRLLGGVTDGVPDEELPAIAFAQHYADTRAHPDPDAWRNLVAAYGEDEALGILGAVRMIMLGNAVGIPWSSLLSRLRGAPHRGSTLGYELGTILGDALVLPASLLHAGVCDLRDEPVLRPGAGRSRRPA